VGYNFAAHITGLLFSHCSLPTLRNHAKFRQHLPL